MSNEYIMESGKFPKIYAYMYNNGLNNYEIAEKLGVSPSTLSKKVKNCMLNGILNEYYNVFLDKLLSNSWVYIIVMNQRLSLSKCFMNRMYPRPTIAYYSPIPRPVYILYYISYSLGAGSNYEEPIDLSSIDLRYCRVRAYGPIEETIIPSEDYLKKRIQLQRGISSRDIDRYSIDAIDDYIARIFFIISNPPIALFRLMRIAENIASKSFSIDIFRNHYYKHVRGVMVHKRITYRQYPREYGIALFTTTGTLFQIETVLNDMIKEDILLGVDQVNIISSNPLIAIVHGWLNKEKLWDHKKEVDIVPNVFYDIFLVKPQIET